MEYDPKQYYPGRWRDTPKGRKKSIYDWDPLAPNETAELMAARLEENNWFVIDLDQINDATTAFLAEMGIDGSTHKHRTQSGGYHWIYEAPDDMPLVRWAKDASPVYGIDFLGQGMLFVPPSKGWEIVDDTELKLPPPALVAYIVAEDGRRKTSALKRCGTRGTKTEADLLAAVTALATISPDCGYDTWIHLGMALSACGEGGYVAWDSWSAGGRDYPGSNETAYKWSTFDPAGAITLGTLFHLAKPPPAKPAPGPSTGKRLADAVMSNDELTRRAAAEPARENWLGPFTSGAWGLIASEPGVGKSLFALALCGAISRGEDFGPWKGDNKARKVLLIDAELEYIDLAARRRVAGDMSNVSYLTMDSLMEGGQDPLSIGGAAIQQELLDLDWDFGCFDCLEYMLDPPEGGELYHADTWRQMHPFINTIKKQRRHAQFIDHTNKDGDIQGTRAKNKGNTYALKLTGLTIGRLENVNFKAELTKYRLEGYRRGDAWLWACLKDGRWTCEKVESTWARIKALRDADPKMTQKAIADKLEIDPSVVSKYFKNK